MEKKLPHSVTHISVCHVDFEDRNCMNKPVFFNPFEKMHPVRLAYQPPASSTFLSEQTSHQQ
jgi:hypothetical protein